MRADRGDQIGLQLAMWLVTTFLLWDAWSDYARRRRSASTWR